VASHRVNPVALVFGLVFAAAGAIVLSGGELIDEGQPLIAAGLIALGVALLVQVVRRARPGDEAPSAVAAATSPDPTAWGDTYGRSSTGSEAGEVCDGDPTDGDPTHVDPTEASDPTTPYDRPGGPDRPDQ
jgi:hypothetical protein